MKSQQTQTTVDKHLLWHWWIPTLCLGSTASLIWLHRVNMCMFTCNRQHAFLAEWPGHFACYCGYTGLEWELKKSQHKNLTLEKKIWDQIRDQTCNFAKVSWHATSELYSSPELTDHDQNGRTVQTIPISFSHHKLLTANKQMLSTIAIQRLRKYTSYLHSATMEGIKPLCSKPNTSCLGLTNTCTSIKILCWCWLWMHSNTK